MVEFDVFEESFNVNFLFPSIFPRTQVKQHWKCAVLPDPDF